MPDLYPRDDGSQPRPSIGVPALQQEQLQQLTTELQRGIAEGASEQWIRNQKGMIGELQSIIQGVQKPVPDFGGPLPPPRPSQSGPIGGIGPRTDMPQEAMAELAPPPELGVGQAGVGGSRLADLLRVLLDKFRNKPPTTEGSPHFDISRSGGKPSIGERF